REDLLDDPQAIAAGAALGGGWRRPRPIRAAQPAAGRRQRRLEIGEGRLDGARVEIVGRGLADHQGPRPHVTRRALSPAPPREPFTSIAPAARMRPAAARRPRRVAAPCSGGYLSERM